MCEKWPHLLQVFPTEICLHDRLVHGTNYVTCSKSLMFDLRTKQVRSTTANKEHQYLLHKVHSTCWGNMLLYAINSHARKIR